VKTAVTRSPDPRDSRISTSSPEADQILLAADGTTPASVGPFVIARHPATTHQFARFIAATRHATVAEQSLDPANAFGMFDRTGNVWEWTDEWWTDGATLTVAGCRAVTREPTEPR
jgi:formylglycine-generating enzyme required for sulfatase activity